MAGDWTPFRHDLIDDPAVMRMSSILSIPRQHVIGCLYCVWTWFDRHTVDGNAVGVTEVEIDALAAHGTFARAMQSVSWLMINSDGCTIPNFDRWMSKSAKKRVNTAKRVATHRKRKCNAGVTPAALPQNRTEQNKREELNSNTDAPPAKASGASNGDLPEEPHRAVQRTFISAGVEPDVSARLAGWAWAHPETANELAYACQEANPENPTGWMIARLRERGIVPKGRKF